MLSSSRVLMVYNSSPYLVRDIQWIGTIHSLMFTTKVPFLDAIALGIGTVVSTKDTGHLHTHFVERVGT